MTQLNTLHDNHFTEGHTERNVSLIPVKQNRTAEYMAIYGMENLSSFVEAPVDFENLRYFLDRDMGMALPFPILDVQQFPGMGKVVDVSPPLSPPFEDVVEDFILD